MCQRKKKKETQKLVKKKKFSHKINSKKSEIRNKNNDLIYS